MVGASSLTFAEKMQQLVEQRAEQQPLPSGFMRCPLNPAHQVPVAVIVRHLEKAHQEDALALAPNAMYGSETYARRHNFIKRQLRCSYDDDSSYGSRSRHRRRRRRSYSDQSSCSSSGSSLSSQNSLLHVKRKDKFNYKKKEEELNSPCVNNNCFSSKCNKALFPQPAPPIQSPFPPPPPSPSPQQQQPLSSPVANWCDERYQQGGLFLNCSTSTLLGRYTLGCSIEWQSLINYLLQFGSLLQCETQPLNATFIAEYDTVEAASRCFLASSPFVIIDGVNVELMPMTSGSKMALTAIKTSTPTPAPITTAPVVFSAGMPAGKTLSPSVLNRYSQAQLSSQSPSTLISLPVVNQQHHGQTNIQPPVIKVAGKTVGVALLGNSGNGCTSNNINFAKKNKQIKTPKCMLLAALKENGNKETNEKCLFEEFVRFGKVVNIMLIGPRVLVEYESDESVEKANFALKKHKEMFSLCVYLNEYDEMRS